MLRRPPPGFVGFISHPFLLLFGFQIVYPSDQLVGEKTPFRSPQGIFCLLFLNRNWVQRNPWMGSGNCHETGRRGAPGKTNPTVFLVPWTSRHPP